MNNTSGKILARLFKSGVIDLKIKEDAGQDKSYYFMQSVQPSAPMIVRKPVDFNGENTICIASGFKIMMVDK